MPAGTQPAKIGYSGAANTPEFDPFKPQQKTVPEPATQSTTPAYASVSPIQTKQEPTEPAVVSSSTIDEQVIPKNNLTLDKLAQKGTYVDMAGLTRYSDGSPVPAPIGATGGDNSTWEANGARYGAAPRYVSGDDPESQKINDLIAGMKSSLDASTKQQLDAIEQNHNVEYAMQKDANARAEKARSATLLNLGTSRYAPFAASGTTLAQTSYGLQQLQAIDAKENAAIANVRKAQSDGDMQLMDKALATVQDIRKQKQEAAQKLIETQQARIKKAQDQEIQASRDSALVDLVRQGVTDPRQLLQYLNYDEQGNLIGDFTAAEIEKTLASIMPKGLSDIAKTAAQNGAPQDVVSKIVNAQDLAGAYAAAGDYIQNGSGIVGEYQFYARQAKAAGQTPVDFNTYQNIDANRKAKVAAAAGGGGGRGGGGKPAQLSDTEQAWVTAVLNGNATMQQVPAGLRNNVALGLTQQPAEAYSPLAASRFTMASNRIVSNFTKLPQYELTANGLPYLERIDAAMQTPGSVSDQDLLDSLVKLNTAGNAITEAQVKLITDGKSFSDSMGVAANKLKNGGVLSDNQRQQIQKIAKAIYANYAKGYQPVYDQATKQLKAAGIPEAFWTIPNLNDLSARGGYGGTASTGNEIIRSEDAAKQSVIDYGTKNPSQQAHIKELSKEYPNYSDIAQILGISQ